MSQQDIVLKLFQFVILLFALSLHEAAHAWMASRLGDQTARMLGRVTLNPVKHIDIFGTIVFPLIAMFSGVPLIGWARPTPVNTRNFRKIVRDDILTTLAGPISNLLAVAICFFLLLAISKSSQAGNEVVHQVATGMVDLSRTGALLPIVLVCYFGIIINLFLTAFNLIPLPPLDGSHVLRHMLPYNVLQIYDRIGIFGLLLIFVFGGRLISVLVSPVLYAIRVALVSL